MAYNSANPVTGGSLVAADIRENFRALKEDSIVVANTAVLAATATNALAVSNAVIAQVKLKTSMGAVSTTTGENLTLPGGEYGFYPQIKGTVAAGPDCQVTASISSGRPLTSYVTSIYLIGTGTTWTAYAQQRYVTSSGEVFWIFILRNKATKKVQSMYVAPDHPCFGNGGKPALMPHPFPDYKPETQEIIVINPSKEQIVEMEARRFVDADDQPDLSLLEVIQKLYEIDEESVPAWPTEKITVGLPIGHDWQNMIGKDVKSIKKSIPKPDYIKVKSLRKNS